MKEANYYLQSAIKVAESCDVTVISERDAIKAIEQAQKDAYNQALEDATKNVRVFKAANSGSWLDAAINTDSILKLKKQ